jgi:hypothetical protein
MSLKTAILDIIGRLKSIPATTYDSYSSNLMKNVAIWNDQVMQSYSEGNNYSLLAPAAFVEVNVSDNDFLGIGYTSCDLNIDIHIVNNQLDAIDGTLDQDLEVFNLRDEIKKWLNLYTPVDCNDILYIDEQQDFTHDNVYHYILSFKTRFTDSAGANIPHQYNGTVSLVWDWEWDGPNSPTASLVNLCQIPSNLTATQYTQTYTYSIISLSSDPVVYTVSYTDPLPGDPSLPIKPDVADIVNVSFDGTFSYYNGNQEVISAERDLDGRTRIKTNFLGSASIVGSCSGTMSMTYNIPSVKINWLPPLFNSDYDYKIRFLFNNFLVDYGLTNSISGSASFNLAAPRDYIFTVRNFCDGNNFTPFVSITFSVNL